MPEKQFLLLCYKKGWIFRLSSWHLCAQNSGVRASRSMDRSDVCFLGHLRKVWVRSMYLLQWSSVANIAT